LGTVVFFPDELPENDDAQIKAAISRLNIRDKDLHFNDVKPSGRVHDEIFQVNLRISKNKDILFGSCVFLNTPDTTFYLLFRMFANMQKYETFWT
jgi:hypothetical protein